MNHYCTYFDQGFLVQGVALAQSLFRHDPDALLWVLALDDAAATTLAMLDAQRLRVVTLAELEAGDPALAAAKANRSRVEYYFTLSPCWPRGLLRAHPEIEALVYVDADMMFFSSPQPIWDDLRRGSTLLCAHRFAGFLVHYEQHGHFNVGVLGWRRDAAGLACLDWWRERCLDWCYDRVEEGRYADQKYLEEWPRRFDGVIECVHPGVNLAPWNWMNHRYEFRADGVRVDGQPVVVFHFARFRVLRGDWWWQSGQLDYGVMPWRLRQAIYVAYYQALGAAREAIHRVAPAWQPVQRSGRMSRDFWRALPLRIVFGTDWWRVGGVFVSGRLGLGRYSGRCLAGLRRILLRR
ncbi:MAG TPA: hypothetical protein VFJ90_03160 [Candidatus Didemnitutus sp.]|nr:hypothetical protein [Candidatus Didemnitutus sp.]